MEHLPTELLGEIFQYFSSGELVQLFSSLNARFSRLIRSFNRLAYCTSRNDLSTHFFPYIRCLILDTAIDYRLDYFIHLRRLILVYVTDDFMSQLVHPSILPNLEHLSLAHQVHPCFMPDLRRRIFSNSFPRLQSCYISRMRATLEADEWTQSPSLCAIELNDIDSPGYRSILAACPNLRSLKFKLRSRSNLTAPMFKHRKLKRLAIDLTYDDWPWDDHMLEMYLACTPHLEQLSVYRWTSTDDCLVARLEHYDWLSSVVNQQLPSLVRFHFYLHVNCWSKAIRDASPSKSNQLQRDFHYAYQYRCQSRLLFY